MDVLSLRDAQRAVARNGAILRALDAHVEALHARGATVETVVWCQVAGEWAFRNHPGP